jgi:hypothetical protein
MPPSIAPKITFTYSPIFFYSFNTMNKFNKINIDISMELNLYYSTRGFNFHMFWCASNIQLTHAWMGGNMQLYHNYNL